jgi:hypothetical protein
MGLGENALTVRWECRRCRGPFGFAQDDNFVVGWRSREGHFLKSARSGAPRQAHPAWGWEVKTPALCLQKTQTQGRGTLGALILAALGVGLG